jgi:hypothetical protein
MARLQRTQMRRNDFARELLRVIVAQHGEHQRCRDRAGKHRAHSKAADEKPAIEACAEP